MFLDVFHSCFTEMDRGGFVFICCVWGSLVFVAFVFVRALQGVKHHIGDSAVRNGKPERSQPLGRIPWAHSQM